MTTPPEYPAATMLPLHVEDGRVVDATGVSWDDATDALCSVLGLCGCGTVIDADIVALLTDPQTPAADLLDGDVYRELLLHLLDSAGLVEHGTSVSYCWRTPLGDRWLEAVRFSRREPSVSPEP